MGDSDARACEGDVNVPVCGRISDVALHITLLVDIMVGSMCHDAAQDI